MMFNKPLDKLTFSDVVAFLNQQQREGLCLDYKLDLPTASSIAKLFCAFANTAGGIVLVGANEQDEVPVGPFEGGNLGGNPNQVVQQACQLVDPQINPLSSAILRNPADNTKGFLVIGIPQSGRTPHAVLPDRRVYVKRGDHKEPVQPTVELYEAIRDSRAKASAQSQAVRDDARGKMQESRDRHCRNSELAERDRYVAVTIEVYREYPIDRTLATPQELVGAYMEYQVHCKDPYMEDARFPASDERHLRTFANGVISQPSHVDGEVLMLNVIHSAGCVLSYSMIGNLRQTVRRREGTLTEVEIMPAHSLCSFVFAGIRSGLRLLRWFNAFAAAGVKVTIESHGARELYTCGTRDILSKEMPLRLLHGPSDLKLDIVEHMDWPSADELLRIEESIATQIVSSFNVSDQQRLQEFIVAGRRNAGGDL